MSYLAGMLAEELGADPQIARAGALLHDIGKVGIPDSILTNLKNKKHHEESNNIFNTDLSLL